jgi:hypothetical protein
MSNIKNLIDMLGFIDENQTNENVLIAKGKYKMPRSIRGMYKVQKRHLKYRNNGGK